jgi:hypothetical protein
MNKSDPPYIQRTLPYSALSDDYSVVISAPELPDTCEARLARPHSTPSNRFRFTGPTPTYGGTYWSPRILHERR